MQAVSLIFPHHGGRAGADIRPLPNSSSNLVAPSQVIFSIGRGLHGTPLPEVIAVARARQGLYVACTQLSERCAAVRPAGTAQHIGAAFASGRNNNSCCAGSVVILLATGVIDQPTQQAHQGFITLNALTALCRN